jgi:molybdate transport system substrate-binding protein
MVRRASFVLAAGLLTGGCGESAAPSGPSLRVAAAPVLEPVLKRCTPRIKGARVRLEIAQSKAIAAEIRSGVRPDLYLAANTGSLRALAREGRVDAPAPYATNQLVIAAPAGDKAIRGIADLTRGHRSLAIGTVSSPLGAYTRYVLGKLSTYDRIQLLSRVRAQEGDAAAVLARLVSQAVQAALVFRTDVSPVKDQVRTVPLPGELGATVVYSMATVKGAPQPAAARLVAADVLRGGCARALREAGFGPPPR